LLNIPGGKPRPDIPILGSRIPKPDEIVMLSQPVLKAVIKLGVALKDVNAKWGVGGDAGEIMKGVNVHADFIEILTTSEGTEQICKAMPEYPTLAPAPAEEKLGRDADVDGKMIPVFIKSNYAELTVDGVKVKVYGDEQIKVGEWEWGDALDFQPEYVYVVGTRVPLVPLRLKSELDLGLGWLDRVELISDAVVRSQHRH
jgi:hypothetical protein